MYKNLLVPVMAVLALPAEARITRIVVEHRESPAYKSQSFKDAGAYERLSGHAYGELDPKDPLNAIITDLQLAPRNARGMVEYAATFSMAKPADLAKASGVLVYLVPNRGNISLEATGALVRDFLNRGHVVLASGWQGDLQPREGLETIAVPVAKNPDGSPVTGPALARFTDMPPKTNTLPIVRGRLAQAGAGQPASLDTSKALLTRRASEDSKMIPIRASDWAFADCTKIAFPGMGTGVGGVSKKEAAKTMIKTIRTFNPHFLKEIILIGKEDDMVKAFEEALNP